MGILKSINGEGFSLSHSLDEQPKNSDFTSHIHDSYELLCLVKGKVDYMVEGNLYKLHQGAVMLMRPSETHNLIINKNTEYERYVLNFTPSLILDAGFSRDMLAPFRKRGLGEKNMYLAEELDHIAPSVYFEKMFAEGEYLSPRDAVLSSLLSLLSEINVAFNKKGETHIAENQMEKELIALVNEHLTEDITIEKIATSLHISPSQVSRLFKRATNTSIHNYIITKRLILFNKKLDKGMGVLEACHECGFRDYSAFYRLYKKRFGTPPTKR